MGTNFSTPYNKYNISTICRPTSQVASDAINQATLSCWKKCHFFGTTNYDSNRSGSARLIGCCVWKIFTPFKHGTPNARNKDSGSKLRSMFSASRMSTWIARERKDESNFTRNMKQMGPNRSDPCPCVPGGTLSPARSFQWNVDGKKKTSRKKLKQPLKHDHSHTAQYRANKRHIYERNLAAHNKCLAWSEAVF